MKYSDGSFAVGYLSDTDCLNCVIDYYRSELTSWGWSLVQEGQDTSRPEAAISKTTKNMPKEMAQSLKEYSEALSDSPELKMEYYFLRFRKQDQGSCTVMISRNDLTRQKVAAVIQYRPFLK
jgi:hypothetical protein